MTSFLPLGFLSGYFLGYSLRPGNRIPDVLKSVLGALTFVAGAFTTALLRDPISIHEAVLGYSLGALAGFAVHAALSVVVSSVYVFSLRAAGAHHTDETALRGWPLWADLLATLLLGKSLRPGRPDA